jgi:hypothetical protein
MPRTPPGRPRKTRGRNKANKIADLPIIPDLPPDLEAKAQEPNKKLGRPSGYKPEFARQAKVLCERGLTDYEIAAVLGCDRATFYRWKAKHADLCAAVKAGSEAADARVERSLFAKATGYTYEALKIFQHQGRKVLVPYTEHVPPDATSCIFWLKNRKPHLWRDVQRNELTGADGQAIQIQSAADEVLGRISRLVARAEAREVSQLNQAAETPENPSNPVALTCTE